METRETVKVSASGRPNRYVGAQLRYTVQPSGQPARPLEVFDRLYGVAVRQYKSLAYAARHAERMNDAR